MTDYKYIIRKKNKKNLPILFNKLNIRIFFVSFLIIFVLSFSSYLYSYIKNNLKIKSPFIIREIKINGVVFSNKSKINEFLSKYKNKSLSEISLQSLYAQLIKFPWINEAIIQKRYPSTLKIEIIENIPFAILNENGNLYIISQDGQIIQKFDNTIPIKNPFIISVKNYQNVQKLLKKSLSEIVSSIQLYDLRNISEINISQNIIKIFTFKPYRIYTLSVQNFKKELSKLKFLKKVVKEYPGIKNNRILTVKLQFKNKIFIKF